MQPALGWLVGTSPRADDGRPGSGSEATCGAYTQLLQRRQAAADNTTGLANQAAQTLLDNDVDNAMNAGCAVIYQT